MPVPTILIVEDESIVAFNIQNILQNRGYSVPPIAVSGEDAINKIERYNPDLVLMDIVLHGEMDGIDVAEQIRSTHDIPIVYLTAYSDDTTTQRAKMTDPFGYILKPFSDKELYSVVEMALYKHKMERNLRRSEEKYRTLAENAMDGIYIISPSGFKYVNPAFETVVGYSAGELCDEAFDYYSLIHPDDRELVRERELKRKKGIELISLTKFRIITVDGSIRHVETNTVPLPGERGTVLGVLRDVTDRLEAEKIFRKCKERYEELFHNMNSGVVVLEAVHDGEDFIIKDFNRAAEHIDHIKREAVIGKSLLDTFPGVRDFGLFDVIQRVWKTGKGEDHPASLYEDYRINGWRKNYVYKLTSGEVVAVYDDITDRKAMEYTLQESEEKYRELVENLHEGIWKIDADTYTTFVNQRMAEMLGYSVEEMIGKHLFEFMDDEGIKKCENLLNRRKEGIKEQHEFEFIRKDGKRIYTLIETSPIADKEGRYLGALAGVQDITERQQMKKALERAHKELVEQTENLERKIQTRTENLMESHKLTSRLLENISHEFITPLTSIIDNSEVFLTQVGRSINTIQRTELEMIREKAENLLSLVGLFEDIYKTEAGTLTLHTELLDVKHLLEEISSALSRNKAYKNIRVRQDIEPNLPGIYADKKRLHQILYDVIGQAVKPGTSGHVTIGAFVQNEDVVIWVKGSQRGRNEKISMVESERSHGSSELKNYLTKKLIELHDGRISIEYTGEKDSHFSFILPGVQ
jgi:PAS domain S-box-containing protein